MIQKLENLLDIRDGLCYDRNASIEELQDKLNEVIDVVNDLVGGEK